MTVSLRPATLADLPGILAIYNHAVLNTTASYEYEPSTLDVRTRWFEEHQQTGLPVVVAETAEGKVAGWGSLSKFRDRIGYQYTVEHSVYVAADQRRKGIARAIVTHMIDAAREMGRHSVIGVVSVGTEASVHLHHALGFEEAGRLKEAGYKFDQWLDVIFFQLMLGK